VPRKCSVCDHPERAEIDANLRRAVSFRRIAARFSVSTGALLRYKASHVAAGAAKPEPEPREAPPKRWYRPAPLRVPEPSDPSVVAARQRQAEQMRRARLAESGFVLVDSGQEAVVLQDGNTLHSRRTISALPGTGPVREPLRWGWW
jgi:hypothetical protein